MPFPNMLCAKNKRWKIKTLKVKFFALNSPLGFKSNLENKHGVYRAELDVQNTLKCHTLFVAKHGLTDVLSWVVQTVIQCIGSLGEKKTH